MFDLKKNGEHILTTDANMQDALKAIEVDGCHMAVIVDDRGQLSGIITDGDIRRALIAGATSQSQIQPYIQTKPRAASQSKGLSGIRSIIQDTGVDVVPVIDDQNRPVALHHIRDLSHEYKLPDKPIKFGGAVIMAGGEGKRLRPLTNVTPRPLVEVGGRPIIDYLLDNVTQTGIDNLHVSINYMGDKIKDRLEDGTKIRYIEENVKLGIAGALSLLDNDPGGPVLVMNGDIITNFDFNQMLHAHKSSKSAFTMGVVEYNMEVPYGVLEIENGNITGLREKPVTRVHINAGIYVLDFELIKKIPKDTYYDMTHVIDDCINAGLLVTPFLIHEDWVDIGNPTDLERAHNLVQKGPA